MSRWSTDPDFEDPPESETEEPYWEEWQEEDYDEWIKWAEETAERQAH